ncbi:hypothetical protein PR048_029723 [Dryococelus australis]|uniref:Uncharacterized protein n=1 Tax=Dryococelus australis TaxID=614101 RepID=A0ABQ9GE58_9NEOP|nr:hypothetical protein PR048_029723 [Dryococelus australis]
MATPLNVTGSKQPLVGTADEEHNNTEAKQSRIPQTPAAHTGQQDGVTRQQSDTRHASSLLEAIISLCNFAEQGICSGVQKGTAPAYVSSDPGKPKSGWANREWNLGPLTMSLACYHWPSLFGVAIANCRVASCGRTFSLQSDYGETPKHKSGGSGISPRKLLDQSHRVPRFPKRENHGVSPQQSDCGEGLLSIGEDCGGLVGIDKYLRGLVVAGNHGYEWVVKESQVVKGSRRGSASSRTSHSKNLTNHMGTTKVERLARSSPTKANRVQSPVGSKDFCKLESCRTMPLVGGFSRGSPVFPTPSFRRCSKFTSITLIGSQDLAVKIRPNPFAYVPYIGMYFNNPIKPERGDGELLVNKNCRHWWWGVKSSTGLHARCFVADYSTCLLLPGLRHVLDNTVSRVLGGAGSYSESSQKAGDLRCPGEKPYTPGRSRKVQRVLTKGRRSAMSSPHKRQKILDVQVRSRIHLGGAGRYSESSQEAGDPRCPGEEPYTPGRSRKVRSRIHLGGAGRYSESSQKEEDPRCPGEEPYTPGRSRKVRSRIHLGGAGRYSESSQEAGDLRCPGEEPYTPGRSRKVQRVLTRGRRSAMSSPHKRQEILDVQVRSRIHLGGAGRYSESSQEAGDPRCPGEEPYTPGRSRKVRSRIHLGGAGRYSESSQEAEDPRCPGEEPYAPGCVATTPVAAFYSRRVNVKSVTSLNCIFADSSYKLKEVSLYTPLQELLSYWYKLHQFIQHTQGNSEPITDLQAKRHIIPLSGGGHGGLAVSLFASHQGDPGSIPGRVTPDFRMWESWRTMLLVGGFSRDLPLPLRFHSDAAPYLPRFTLIGCQDLYVQIPSLTSICNGHYLLKASVPGSQEVQHPRWPHYSPLTQANPGSIPGRVTIKIFACVNRAGRCRSSAGFLGGLPFPPALHVGKATKQKVDINFQKIIKAKYLAPLTLRSQYCFRVRQSEPRNSCGVVSDTKYRNTRRQNGVAVTLMWVCQVSDWLHEAVEVNLAPDCYQALIGEQCSDMMVSCDAIFLACAVAIRLLSNREGTADSFPAAVELCDLGDNHSDSRTGKWQPRLPYSRGNVSARVTKVQQTVSQRQWSYVTLATITATLERESGSHACPTRVGMSLPGSPDSFPAAVELCDLGHNHSDSRTGKWQPRLPYSRGNVCQGHGGETGYPRENPADDTITRIAMVRGEQVNCSATVAPRKLRVVFRHSQYCAICTRVERSKWRRGESQTTLCQLSVLHVKTTRQVVSEQGSTLQFTHLQSRRCEIAERRRKPLRATDPAITSLLSDFCLTSEKTDTTYRTNLKYSIKDPACLSGCKLQMPALQVWNLVIPSLYVLIPCLSLQHSDERLACSPPIKAIRIQSPVGSLRIFACGNRAGRCRWSAGFLGNIPFPLPLHSGAAPYSPRSPSSDLDVKSRPNIFSHSRSWHEHSTPYHLACSPLTIDFLAYCRI